MQSCDQTFRNVSKSSRVLCLPLRVDSNGGKLWFQHVFSVGNLFSNLEGLWERLDPSLCSSLVMFGNGNVRSLPDCPLQPPSHSCELNASARLCLSVFNLTLRCL